MPGERTILINRAPVLTLWAATVAERLGFDQDEALSLGKAVAGLNAQSKGQRLGIFKPAPQEVKKARARKRGEEYFVEICGRQVPAINTAEGLRAVIKNQPIETKSVERYLESKFGESLGPAREAMRDLAKAFRPKQLAENAFGLYEQFRPAIPEGVRGWGAKGNLNIDRIPSLALEK
jgi:sirohydrochlorin ferrochelatase